MFRITTSIARTAVIRNSYRSFQASSARLAEPVYFTKDHEWIQLVAADSNVAKVGITKHAADALGEITYLDLDGVTDLIDDGETVDAEDTLTEVESVKSASEIKMPVTGTPTTLNEALSEDDFTLLSKDPENAGFICEVEVQSADDLSSLMDKDGYAAYLESEK